MATGTGKTFTALVAATELSKEIADNRKKPLLIIVAAPATDLVEQWRSEADLFGFRTSICYSGIPVRERQRLEQAFTNVLAPRGRRTEMVITTGGSLTPASDQDENEHYLQRKIRDHKGPLLFIGDEMHSFGTKRRLGALPENAEFRLGLSATPRRHDDEEGTEELFEYFGEVVKEIDIKDAIYEIGCLVPYKYEPYFVTLTPGEHKEYRALCASIASAMGSDDRQGAKAAGLRANAVNMQTRNLKF